MSSQTFDTPGRPAACRVFCVFLLLYRILNCCFERSPMKAEGTLIVSNLFVAQLIFSVYIKVFEDILGRQILPLLTNLHTCVWMGFINGAVIL